MEEKGRKGEWECRIGGRNDGKKSRCEGWERVKKGGRDKGWEGEEWDRREGEYMHSGVKEGGKTRETEEIQMYMHMYNQQLTLIADNPYAHCQGLEIFESAGTAVVLV